MSKRLLGAMAIAVGMLDLLLTGGVVSAQDTSYGSSAVAAHVRAR